jgi:shikimate dehydrogenase
MQNAAFAAAGLSQWRYELWETAPDAVEARMREIRTTHTIMGANVTVPHKLAVVPFLDHVSPQASAIGAVNTIIKRDGGLLGDNTDWKGFLADLHFHGVKLASNSQAVVLGAGGSARAIVYALISHGMRVTVVNRDDVRADQLVSSLAGEVTAPGATLAWASLEQLPEFLQSALIVNCTSAGMSPDDYGTPWPYDLAFPKRAILYDLVYKPRVTALMREAASVGARVIGGIGMLAEQGAAAFELWTGVPAARVAAAMRKTLD